MSGYLWCEAKVGAWKPDGGLYGARIQTSRRVTIPHCLEQMEGEGRLRNFRRAAGQVGGTFEGHYSFDDSDVYKVLEGIGYHLALSSDPALERRADQIIAEIAAAQAPDGYLFTWNQVKHPERRWTDMNSHEMYCGGHLFEAAAVYYRVTGKPEILNIARRLANHYREIFGPGRRHWVDGHEEVGLALSRLSDVTGDPAFRQFAHWHLEERGRDYGQGNVWDLPGFGPKYSQDHLPVSQIREAEGHAVRAMYLYSAMAEVVAYEGDERYREALERVYQDVVERKMYVTGGVGAVGNFEGFGPAYYLPNDTAYCETCAAIGMVLWNHRMNLLTGDARHADMVELELFNGVLAGVSLSGDRFFYGNPLASDGTVHRSPWFSCSCCPSNVARFIPQVGRFTYAVGPETLIVNQFLPGQAILEVAGQPVTVTQTTDFPWKGTIRLALDMPRRTRFSLYIRQPFWAPFITIKVNGEDERGLPIIKGYRVLQREFNPGDEISLTVPLEVQRVRMPEQVEADRGQVALKRGPVVYCFEETDNVAHYDKISVEAESRIAARWRDDLLGGIMAVTVSGSDGRQAAMAIPYHLWDHRDAGRMRVFVPG